MYQAYYQSIVGILKIVADDKAILCVDFCDEVKEEKMNPILQTCIKQLDEYFKGIRKSFDVAIHPKGTPFQLKVWNELQKIPYGETCSYQYVAQQCGNKKASRAVGMANNRNPICILIPCHRVIGASGKLVGYGGGLDKKITLLQHEQKYK